MRHRSLGLALVFIGALVAGLYQNPTVVRADGICFNAGVPTPAPVKTGQVTLGVCINGILQTAATGGATPIPFPTFPWPVVLPTSYQTAFPTPIPNPTSTAPGATATPAVSSSSGTILAAGGSTLGYALCNPNAFAVYVNFGSTASVAASTLYFAPFPAPCYLDRGPYRYQGIITAITATSSGTMNVTTF